MLPDAIESDPTAKEWDRALADRYRRFAEELASDHGLRITVGRGGLSFYAPGMGRFLCHFNASPRKGREDLGFVDFKPHVLVPELDPSAVVVDLQRRLGFEIPLRAGKVWYGAQFLREQDALVAAAFRLAVVNPFLGGFPDR